MGAFQRGMAISGFMGGVEVNPDLCGENRGLEGLPLAGFKVEVGPTCDPPEITAFVATNRAREFLLVLASNR